MTNGERQRKMDFIVEQRAQFRADIRLLKKRYSQATKRLARTEEIVTRIEGEILTLTQKK